MFAVSTVFSAGCTDIYCVGVFPRIFSSGFSLFRRVGKIFNIVHDAGPVYDENLMQTGYRINVKFNIVEKSKARTHTIDN